MRIASQTLCRRGGCALCDRDRVLSAIAATVLASSAARGCPLESRRARNMPLWLGACASVLRRERGAGSGDTRQPLCTGVVWSHYPLPGDRAQEIIVGAWSSDEEGLKRRLSKAFGNLAQVRPSRAPSRRKFDKLVPPALCSGLFRCPGHSRRTSLGRPSSRALGAPRESAAAISAECEGQRAQCEIVDGGSGRHFQVSGAGAMNAGCESVALRDGGRTTAAERSAGAVRRLLRKDAQDRGIDSCKKGFGQRISNAAIILEVCLTRVSPPSVSGARCWSRVWKRTMASGRRTSRRSRRSRRRSIEYDERDARQASANEVEVAKWPAPWSRARCRVPGNIRRREIWNY